MFVTLSPLRRPPGRGVVSRIKHRLLDKLKPPSPMIDKIQLEGSFYTDIRFHTPTGLLSEEQERLVRRISHQVLCAPGISLPAGCRNAVTPAQIQRMLAQILCNTLVDSLEKSAVPLYRRSIGIVDRDCAFPHLLDLLIKHTPQVWIYTENQPLYHGYAERILDEYGAPITFTADLFALKPCTLILALDTCVLPSLYPTPILALFPPADKDDEHPGVNNLIVRQPTFAFKERAYFPPPDIDPYAFYAALYECCGIQAVYTLCADGALCGTRSISTQDLIEQLLQNQTRVVEVL